MKTMSADVFLSRQNPAIKYDNSHFKGTAQEIVANLVLLNATRTWDPETESFDYTVYHTPGFIAGPVTAATTSGSETKAENKAMEVVHAVEKTGNHVAVYAVVDVLNHERMGAGGVIGYQPPSDFDLYSFQKTGVGELARQIIADRVNMAGQTDDDGNPVLPWFDTKAAFDSLTFYAA